MAYPTAAQYSVQALDLIGAQIQNVDSTQKFALGTLCKGVDFGSLQYGQATFMYLKGVASTAAGDIVVFNPVAGTTVRAVTTTRGPLAVAMAAIVASKYGWYCVQGSVPVNTASAGTGAANPFLELSATDGQATVAGANHAYWLPQSICKTAQDTPSVGFTQVQINWPATNSFTATAQAPA